MQELLKLVIDENDIAFHPSTGNSYQLNDIAKEIINFLKEGKDKDTIIEEIAKEYGKDRKEVYIDVSDFLNKLKIYGLI